MKATMKIMALLLFCSVVFASPALADYAKDITPAPAGTKAFLFYYQYATGNEKYVDGDSVGDDFNLTTSISMYRFVYFDTVAGMPWDINVLVPVGSLSLDGADVGGVEISNTQIGDPLFVSTIWPIANPDTRTYVGFTFFVTPPIGEYDRDKALNMGSNRWAFKGHAGMEQGFGNFNLSVYAYAEIYTDNNDSTAAGLTLKKDPFIGAETHLAYDLTKNIMIALDYYYEGGGQTELDGAKNNDELNDHSVGFTAGYMITPNTQILLSHLNKVKTDNGVKTDTAGLRLAYFF